MRVFIAFCLLCFLPALPAQNVDAQKEDPVQSTAEPLKQMIDVFATVEEQAASPIDPDAAFFQGAIPSMLRTLDPHSSFFDPEQFQQLQDMQRSEQKGFGSI